MNQSPTQSGICSGTQAIARGAWEAGVHCVSSYPGSPVTDIVNETQKFAEMKVSWAANEKVALEVAAGVAHGGGRTLVVMKHVGLNVAADPLFNLAYTGVEGGLVIVVGDDPGAKNSQNEQDTRLLAKAANVPVLEPADIAEAYLFTKKAFEISEQFDVPVIVRVTSEHCYGTQSVEFGQRQAVERQFSFAAPIQKYLLVPAFVPKRHEVLLNNIDGLANSQWGKLLAQSTISVNNDHRHPYGIICSGTIYKLVKEVTDKHKVPLLKLGLSFPTDQSLIREFADLCDNILVLEDSSNALKEQVESLGIQCLERSHYNGVGAAGLKDLKCDALPSWNQLVDNSKRLGSVGQFDIPVKYLAVSSEPEPESTSAIPLPERSAGFCAGCSHSPIFYELHKRDLYVVGDIGCYTLGSTQPFSSHDANLCMGASVGILQGYINLMGKEASKRAVAVIGDSTFFHSGIPSLLTAINQQVPATILLLDNSGAAMTGHQTTVRNLTGEQWIKCLEGLGVEDCKVVNALDVNEIATALDAGLASEQLSVVVAKGSCVQSLPNSKRPTNFRYEINADLCTDCGKCLETDCPSIVMNKEDQSVSFEITNECIGCGFCSQTCPENAILPRTVNFKNKLLTKGLSKLPWHKIIHTLKSQPVVGKWLDKFEREMY